MQKFTMISCHQDPFYQDRSFHNLGVDLTALVSHDWVMYLCFLGWLSSFWSCRTRAIQWYCDLQLSLETRRFTAQFDRWNAQVTKGKFKCCQAELSANHSEEGVVPSTEIMCLIWGNAFFTMIGRKCLNLPWQHSHFRLTTFEFALSNLCVSMIKLRGKTSCL
jgi:hypothetical protein